MFPWNFFPFSEDMNKINNNMTPNEVHSYINEVMKKYLPSLFDNIQAQNHQQQSGKNSENEMEINVFETFDHVYVRIQLPQHTIREQLKIFHTSNQVIIENVDDNKNRKIITLPCLVKKRGAIAQLKDQILEIKIPRNNDYQFTEISVSEKL